MRKTLTIKSKKQAKSGSYIIETNSDEVWTKLDHLNDQLQVGKTYQIELNPTAYNNKTYNWIDTKVEQPILPMAGVRVASSMPKSLEPDWDAIAEGKVRHGIVCAMIEAGKDFKTIQNELPALVNLVMGKETKTVSTEPPMPADEEIVDHLFE